MANPERTYIGPLLGIGAESRCYQHTTNPETGKKQTVIKVPRRSAHLWQTVTREHMQRCLDIAQKYGIRILPTEVVDEVILYPEKGKPFRTSVALIVQYVENIDKATLTFKELTDPEKGPKLIRELMEIAEKMFKIRTDENLGLDPVGAKMILDGVKAIIKAIIIQATNQAPGIIKRVIQRRCSNYTGTVNNLIVDENGELVLMDTGMHDFSPEGKMPFITNLANRFQSTALIEIIREANRRLPKDKQIPEKEIEAIPCIGNFFDKVLTQILMEQAMITIDSTLAKS